MVAVGSGSDPEGRGFARHTLSAERVLHAEEVDGQRGLSSAAAAARGQRFGPNELAAGQAEPRWHAFIRQYRDPMLNAAMGLQQEGKAAAAVAALRRMTVIKARVRRDGQLAEIPAGQLVPGEGRFRGPCDSRPPCRCPPTAPAIDMVVPA